MTGWVPAFLPGTTGEFSGMRTHIQSKGIQSYCFYTKEFKIEILFGKKKKNNKKKKKNNSETLVLTLFYSIFLFLIKWSPFFNVQIMFYLKQGILWPF